MKASWREAALRKLLPTPAEDAEVQDASQELSTAVAEFLAEQRWEGRPRVEGSVAKGTYLRGHADSDVFVAFPTDLPREELVRRAHAMARLLDDPVIAYAEHPYAQGLWKGHRAEIVPCYDVTTPAALLSAVDRTRFHTDYVLAHLDERGKEDVRLLKAFLHAADAYGAEESVLGFSGYLAELVVIKFQTFEGVLEWAAKGFAQPVVFEHPLVLRFEDALVVLDPVDHRRNAAAAAAPATLARIRAAAQAFLARPDVRFFERPPPALLAADDARGLCRQRSSRILALLVPCQGVVLEEPLFAQVRRATRLASDALEREQLAVHASAIHIETGSDGRPLRAWGLLEADERALGEPKLHAGPPASAEAHVARFRERWQGAPDAVGAIEERDGRLLVRARRKHTRLGDMVAPLLTQANAGKIVDAAILAGTLEILEGEDALTRVPPQGLGKLLDRRAPWERWDE